MANDGTLVEGREIAEVVIVDHVAGLVQGMGVGVLIGLGAAGLGALSGDDPPCESGTWFCWRLSAGDKALVGGVGIGVPAVLVSGIVGAIIGQRDHYVIASPERARVMVTPIPHGGAMLVSWSF
jgi:hypothetical protein